MSSLTHSQAASRVVQGTTLAQITSLSPNASLHSNVFVSFFVLCHLAAPDESEESNVVQSDEAGNGILLSHSLLSE